jgi:uncharacterized protein
LVGTSLLDINVLLASVDQDHVDHRRVHSWLEQQGSKSWATCPLTQAGFVRIISTPGFHPNRVSVAEALQMLADITKRPGHHFWPINIGLSEAVQPFEEKLFGHRQVTDAYLLGLAIGNKGRLVTLDRGVAALAGHEFAQHAILLT